MHLRKLVFATIATAIALTAADSPFQARYAANLNVGDSFINITNTGANEAGVGSNGLICVNVYAFSPDEQLFSCCSCPVTPNGLVSLSVKRDMLPNSLFSNLPTSIVVKLLATVPVAGSCNNSSPSVTTATLATGLAAWGTTVHTAPVSGTYAVTETAFTTATPSAGELSRMGNLCTFILANGSGFGICRSCRLGGLGATRQ
jgi:hypothetical protein